MAIELVANKSSKPFRGQKGETYEARIWRLATPEQAVVWACAGTPGDTANSAQRNGVPFTMAAPLVFVADDEAVTFWSDNSAFVYVRKYVG